MDQLRIRDRALLIGYSPEGACVYSEQMQLGDYWDGEHLWDSADGISKLRLQRVRGYLFDSEGDLMQEFESIFDLATGIFKSGWSRHSDGTYQEHAA